jgi:hypothetical protein
MRIVKNTLSIAVISALMVAAPAAIGAGAQTVNLSATVLGICKFTTGQNPVVTIKNTGAVIDPSLAGPATGNTAVTYSCTKGQAASLVAPPATATITNGAPTPTTMTVALTYSALAAGTGFSTAPLSFTVTGNVNQSGAGGYQDVPAGAYTGSVTLTINP